MEAMLEAAAGLLLDADCEVSSIVGLPILSLSRSARLERYDWSTRVSVKRCISTACSMSHPRRHAQVEVIDALRE